MANYDAIATRVMRGDFGNGEDRKRRLRAEGYTNAEISAIQTRVNQMFYGAPATPAPPNFAPNFPPNFTPAPPNFAPNFPPNFTPPPPPKPIVPKYLSSSPVQPVKYASPDVVLTDQNSLPVDLILKLTLEKIGGLELISLVRHDTVNGQEIAYQPVKNLSQLAVLYNPQNMVKIPDSSELYFKNFAIKLESHIPPVLDDEIIDIDMFTKHNNVYLNPLTESVVIEVFDLKPDYEVEVQTISLGKVFDDTIYDEDES